MTASQCSQWETQYWICKRKRTDMFMHKEALLHNIQILTALRGPFKTIARGDLETVPSIVQSRDYRGVLVQPWPPKISTHPPQFLKKIYLNKICLSKCIYLWSEKKFTRLLRALHMSHCTYPLLTSWVNMTLLLYYTEVEPMPSEYFSQ